jgi:hypothetical protein
MNANPMLNGEIIRLDGAIRMQPRLTVLDDEAHQSPSHALRRVARRMTQFSEYTGRLR